MSLAPPIRMTVWAPENVGAQNERHGRQAQSIITTLRAINVKWATMHSIKSQSILLTQLVHQIDDFRVIIFSVIIKKEERKTVSSLALQVVFGIEY
jgi:hypothetical protein